MEELSGNGARGGVSAVVACGGSAGSLRHDPTRRVCSLCAVCDCRYCGGIALEAAAGADVAWY